MSFRYAAPRFSRMMWARGPGFWRRRGPGPFCGMYNGNGIGPRWWRNRSPFCRFDNWVESQYSDFDGAPMRRSWFNWRPWWTRDDYTLNQLKDKDVAVKHTDKVYEVAFNVDQFDPENLELKISGNTITISGRHEAEHDDLGAVSQEFARTFNIPEDVDLDSIQSTLSPEGHLIIKGIVKRSADAKSRFIDIEKK